MSTDNLVESRKLILTSKPQNLFFLPSSDRRIHQRTVGECIVRESYGDVIDPTFESGTVEYVVSIETVVPSCAEISNKEQLAGEIADELNRMWTYVCGSPLNGAHLCLALWEPPQSWTSNRDEVARQLRGNEFGVTFSFGIEPRRTLYVERLPLSRALDLREAFVQATDYVRELIEFHYEALISENTGTRILKFAKALEIVRKILPGSDDFQKQSSLPEDVQADFRASLHWLYGIANTRSTGRHVVSSGPSIVLHPRMTSAEVGKFEHDADLVIRTVVCQQLGHEHFIIREGARPPGLGTGNSIDEATVNIS